MKIGVWRGLRAVAVITPLALFGCIQEFKDVNALVGRSSDSVAAVGPMPHMSIRQAQVMRDQLRRKLSDRSVLQAREEASGAIEKILTITGCCPNFDISSYLTPYRTPDAHAMQAPMARMKYHPRSQCLTVTRVDGWTRPSENALSFRAVFLSETSLESSLMKYEMVKQPDGAWLLR